MKRERTSSQKIILRLLNQLKRSISAQELYLELRERKQKMGLATVYRSLEALKMEGVVQVRTLATGESLYSSIAKYQHHLTCLNCGQSIPINQCPVQDLENHLEESHDFKVYYHTLEFFGLCHLCDLATANG
ncbi:MAG: transcriptional repressor [Hormoscilla sp. SP5CHS1]|nr:transcriptional repressor [Hormoscilla sp. SP5CHS1]